MNQSLYVDAVRLSIGAGIASASLLRCCCRISYPEAVEIIDQMEADGYVGPAIDSKPRTIRRKTMQLQQPFDARQVEPASFAPPPPYGDYHVRIADSDAKPTKDNSGGYVELTLEILDPQFQGRKIPYRLNIFNQNQQTVEIAYRQLSAVCWVTGVFNVQDTRQLHNIPFIATIGPQKSDPQYPNVFQVKDINGNLPGKAGQGQPAAPAAPPAAAPAPPQWGAPPAQPPAPATQPPPAWGAMPSTHPAQPPAPAAPGPPPAWGAPAPAAPAWGAPTPAAPPPAAPAPPAWGQQPPQAAPAAPAAPPWAPANAAPAAPPWANK